MVKKLKFSKSSKSKKLSKSKKISKKSKSNKNKYSQKIRKYIKKSKLRGGGGDELKDLGAGSSSSLGAAAGSSLDPGFNGIGASQFTGVGVGTDASDDLLLSSTVFGPNRDLSKLSGYGTPVHVQPKRQRKPKTENSIKLVKNTKQLEQINKKLEQMATIQKFGPLPTRPPPPPPVGSPQLQQTPTPRV